MESLLLNGVVIGLGATVVMDLWGVVLHLVIRQPLPNFNILGRWLGHAFRGKFFHDSIGAAPKLSQEFALGILLHCGVGALFGVGLLLVVGSAWLAQPTLVPAVLWGVATICIPWFFFQPALGVGVASSKVANRPRALSVGLSNHFVFGVGLWISALALTFI